MEKLNPHPVKLEGGKVFEGADPKKRTGRAAPQVRCHSCNRADTSEWRRGPDGAGTLCNSCGLRRSYLTLFFAPVTNSPGKIMVSSRGK